MVDSSSIRHGKIMSMMKMYNDTGADIEVEEMLLSICIASRLDAQDIPPMEGMKH